MLPRLLLRMLLHTQTHTHTHTHTHTQAASAASAASAAGAASAASTASAARASAAIGDEYHHIAKVLLCFGTIQSIGNTCNCSPERIAEGRVIKASTPQGRFYVFRNAASAAADHRVIGLPCSVGKGAAQAEIGLLRCAALPGTLGPWPLRPWHLENRTRASTRHLGFPKGQWVSPTERDCKAQGLEGARAKARSRSQEHERKTKRARPRGRDQEGKSLKPRATMSGPPTERGCKAQGLDRARALRPWGSDGSKASGHGRSPCYRSSVFRRKGRSPS
jgi:hypothetical protein